MTRRRQRNSTIVTCEVGRCTKLPRPRKHRLTKAAGRINTRLMRGPLDGSRVVLHDLCTTLPITVRGESGRYINGYWEPSNVVA